MTMPVAQLSASTLKNGNPVHPRKKKTYQISYWFPEPTARVPLIVKRFPAWNRDDAMGQIRKKHPEAVIRACFKWYPVMGEQVNNRGINPTTGELHRASEYKLATYIRGKGFQGRPCKCGCGAICGYWKQYATEECARLAKNRKQQISKKKRIKAAKKAGRKNFCHNCIIRDAVPDRIYCERCRRY